MNAALGPALLRARPPSAVGPAGLPGILGPHQCPRLPLGDLGIPWGEAAAGSRAGTRLRSVLATLGKWRPVCLAFLICQ